jgi:hypothetical protein
MLGCDKTGFTSGFLHADVCSGAKLDARHAFAYSTSVLFKEYL